MWMHLQFLILPETNVTEFWACTVTLSLPTVGRQILQQVSPQSCHIAEQVEGTRLATQGRQVLGWNQSLTGQYFWTDSLCSRQQVVFVWCCKIYKTNVFIITKPWMMICVPTHWGGELSGRMYVTKYMCVLLLNCCLNPYELSISLYLAKMCMRSCDHRMFLFRASFFFLFWKKNEQKY